MTRRKWIGFATAVPAVAQDIDLEILSLARNAPLAMQFRGGTAQDCRAWQRSFAAKLDQMLGQYQPPAKWESTSERTVDCKEYVRHEWLVRADGFRPLPMHLLLPKGGGKRPGILALHGHGDYAHDSVAGIDDTPERKREIAGYHYDYGRELARRGYAVAVPCFTPFGRRLGNRKTYQGADACGVTFVRMQLMGKLLMAENLRDALWALEVLARHESVDQARLGCVGLSLGGRMAMMTAAVSPRIRVAVPSGALNMMQERIEGHYGCGAQVIPGLLQYGDVPEIASLIAPRPCLWETGQKDKLTMPDRIGPALTRMRRAWSAFGADNRLQVDSFDGGHQWNGVAAYPLLAGVLRP